jgi:hypothetical protein
MDAGLQCPASRGRYALMRVEHTVLMRFELRLPGEMDRIQYAITWLLRREVNTSSSSGTHRCADLTTERPPAFVSSPHSWRSGGSAAMRGSHHVQLPRRSSWRPG